MYRILPIVLWMSLTQHLYSASLGPGELERIVAALAKDAEAGSSSSSSLLPQLPVTHAASPEDSWLAIWHANSRHIGSQQPTLDPVGGVEPVFRSLDDDLESLRRDLHASPKTPAVETEPRGSTASSAVETESRQSTATAHLVPELDLDRQLARLQQIRNEFLHAAGLSRVYDVANAVSPYKAHLTVEQFSSIVESMESSAPWLWTSDRVGNRLLLRQENTMSPVFELTFGFTRTDPSQNQIFLSVWQETGSLGSDIWQLLGLIKGPTWRSLQPFKASYLNNNLYPITNYRVLSGSIFTTRIGTGGL